MAIALSLLAPLVVFQPAETRAADHVNVFGSKETKYKGLKPFPKWTGVLKRYLK